MDSDEELLAGPAGQGMPDPADDDLLYLLAPGSAGFGTGAPPVPHGSHAPAARPAERPVQVPEPAGPRPAEPVRAAEPSEAPPAARSRAPDLPSAPAPVPVAGPPRTPEGWVAVGQWFQPLPGGVLPRPAARDPRIASLAALPGSSVHAVTTGKVRRSPAQVDPSALELHAADGATFIYTGTATIAWAADDDQDVPAGGVLGVVAATGSMPVEELMLIAVTRSGEQVDAVQLLVGLPDPGELDLQADGLGIDPYRIDLEIAGRAELRSTS